MNKLLKITFLFILLSLSLGHGSEIDAQQVCPLDSLEPRKVENLKEFNQIPVLNEGRIKPMITFAETFLLRLSGRRSYKDEDASHWFARFLFAPRTTYDDKIFLINNPDILEAIKVTPEKRRRYSYNQIEKGYDKLKELALVVDTIEDNERSVVDQEILRTYSNLVYYIRLSGAFAWAFPHPDFNLTNTEVKETLQLDQSRDQFSFFDIYKKTDLLMTNARSTFSKPQEEWTDADKIYNRFVNAMVFWSDHYSGCPLGIMPTVNHTDEQWISPMDIIRLNVNNETYAKELQHLSDMVMHYWNAEQVSFDLSTKSYIASVSGRLSPKETEAVKKFPLELIYNKGQFFTWSKVLYIIAVLVVLISLMTSNTLLPKIGLGLTIAAAIPHTYALILRMMILSRPPVSNLYETFIFVGIIGVFLGLIIERFAKNQLGLAVASICGCVFLFISGKFASDGDTLQMLVAVLDSNFWLSTHVITITIGYAACCVAGVIGHIYILQLLFKPDQKQLHISTMSNMLGILGFGLIMTFLGTALGGIWADQSWGRFWGWDPKENGALMIVIWTAIIFHARLAKLIHALGVAVFSILGLIVVMWAWFGVNLLSIGLHSYGFTSGIANALMLYVVAEIVFISVTVTVLGKRQIKF